MNTNQTEEVTVGRPKSSIEKSHVGLLVEKPIYQKLSVLAQRSGVSIAFAVKRAVVQMIVANKVPDVLAPVDDEMAVADETPEESEGYGQEELLNAVVKLQQEVEKLKQEKAGVSKPPRYVGLSKTERALQEAPKKGRNPSPLALK